tara:strand:+ start:33 stop:704 length:672 start_codon:yes stop_codon:yes gene_type:complete
MATSGAISFSPDATEFAEEAFERCGIQLRAGYDNQTSRRSMNFILTHWANRGINLWAVKQRQLPLVTGQAEYSLPADIIDVISATILRDDADINIGRISREEFLNISNKASQGRPSQWYVHRGADFPVLNLFLTPENSTDIFKYNAMVRIQDISKAIDEVHVPFRFYEAFVAGVAYHISVKRAPDKVAMLKAMYDEAFAEAAAEDRDRAPLKIIPDVSAYYRV